MKTALTSLALGATALLGAGVAAADTNGTKDAASPTAEVFFDFDSARLGEATADALAPIVTYAKSHPTSKVVLDASCDPSGSNAYNAGLATRRGEVVRDRLMLAGIDKNQIVIGVYGEDGLRRASHAQDRRVSLWVTEMPLNAVIDHTFERGTAVLWTKPVPATAMVGPKVTQVEFL